MTMPDRRLDNRVWLCFRGPYDVSAWAALWSRAKLLEFLAGHEIAEAVIKDHPNFESIRIERHPGEDDDDGRIYSWGEKEPHAEGPDTQHKGTLVYVDGKLVFSNIEFVDTEDTEHVAEDCEMCARPVA
jgi:hypothetical protein